MKSTQDKFRLVTKGKMLKKDFLKEVKQTHRNVIHQTTTYRDAVKILKNKNIINEHYLGIATQKPIGNPINSNNGTDWFKIFNDNVINEDEKDTKAELKSPDKDVIELETKGYDYKDKDNVNNMNFNEFLTGYYSEMKNPKNANKTEVELKEIVTKNLEKNSQYYIENGQFGETDLGYTADTPGLKQTEIKGKYVSSGYGDSSTKQVDNSPQELKEGHIKLTDLIKEEWIDYGAGIQEDDTPTYEEDDLEEAEEEKEEKPEKKKKAKKNTVENRMREIEDLGKSTALEAKIQAVAEEITSRQDKLQVAENMEEVAEFINPVRVKEMHKEIKLLEKRKTMYERMYKKLTKEDYRAPIVDEDITPEV